MTVYYNENDPFAAAWLRALIAEGLLPDGQVDERSVLDVRGVDLAGFTQCHFFAGIGGWAYALALAGWGDRPVWTGSCPCQPFSLAGRQQGFDDERHLWPAWRHLIEECRPAVVLGEQVASAAQWLGLVRSDLEALGYAVGAIPVEAASAGAYHLRDRYWFVANADVARSQGRPVLPERAGQRPAGANGVAYGARQRRHGGEDPAGPRGRGGAEDGGDGDMVDGASERCGEGPGQFSRVGSAQRDAGSSGWITGADGKARRVEPGIRLLAHGVPNRVGTLRGFGNAIDPRPATAFIEAFMSAEAEGY
jgi:DNA (cytosine-5)-methyltransferase 1